MEHDIIVIETWLGKQLVYSWAEVEKVIINSAAGEHVLTFENGDKMHVSIMMRGADQIAAELRERGFR